MEETAKHGFDMLGPGAQAEIDAALNGIMRASRTEVHRTLELLLRAWPALTRGDFYRRRRQLRYNRSKARNTRAIWPDEDFSILWESYQRDPRETTRRLLERHPDWSPRVVWYMAEKLGLAVPRPRSPHWSRAHDHYLRILSQEAGVEELASRTGRSITAVKHRLCINGASGRIRFPSDVSARTAARLLNQAHTTVLKWIALGLLPARRDGAQYRVNITALQDFCRRCPDRVRSADCEEYLSEWIENDNERRRLLKRQRQT